MIRTVVCEKDGCSGNRFYINTVHNLLEITCSECGSKYNIENEYSDYITLSNCSKCDNYIFKVFKDTENSGIYMKCAECGEAPEKIYVDSDGVQVSYESKILNEIKSTLKLVEQRMCNLEVKIQDLERGQDILEESLAYINRFIVEQS